MGEEMGTNIEEGSERSTDGVAGTPKEAALRELMERTKYPIRQFNGQRRYGPPPAWDAPPPPRGCEVFVGKVPRDLYEDELVPVFESLGKIYEVRLMMDFNGQNRGYAFVVYTNKEDAKKSVKTLNNYEIRKGKCIGVCSSVDNCRLFVGGIPKKVKKDEIMSEMIKVTDDVVDVIVYPSAQDKTKNRLMLLSLSVQVVSSLYHLSELTKHSRLKVLSVFPCGLLTKKLTKRTCNKCCI